MNKKGISLIVLVVTIAVMIIISGTVIFTGLDFNDSTESVKFEKSITLIEKTIRKEYIKGNIIGISLEDYETNNNNEQSQFDFTQEELNNIIEDIKNQNTTLLIDYEKNDYYLINKEHLELLGINEIYEEYLVNYEKGFVFCLSPMIDENNNKIYTTQFTQQVDIIDLKQGNSLEIYSKKNKIIDFKIYGNSIQKGTPSLNSPIEIQSVGDKTKNLIDKNLSQVGYYNKYVKADGYTVDGKLWSESTPYTGQTSSSMVWYVTNPIKIKPNTVYSYSGFQTNNNPAYFFLEADKTTIINGEAIKGSGTFTTPENARYIVMSLRSDFLETMMLQEGGITEYEPYGYIINLNINDNVYNIVINEPLRKVGEYADYIDLKNKKVVRYVKEEVFDGSEEWIGIAAGESSYERFIHNYESPIASGFCNIGVHNANAWSGTIFDVQFTTTGVRFYRPFYDGILINTPSLSNWKSYIKDRYNNSTPIIVDYVLSTPDDTEKIEIPDISLNKGINNISVKTSVKANIEIEYYKGRFLPKEYQEIEYIQCTAKQYIDSGVVATSEIKTVVEYMVIASTNAYKVPFGVVKNAANYACGMSNTNIATARYYNNNYNSWMTNSEIEALIVNKKYKMELNKNSFLVDDELILEIPNATFNSGLNIYIGALNNNGNVLYSYSAGNMKIYSVKIYDNDVLVRDFVPCYEKATNKTGLYDFENSLFYEAIYDETGSEFIKGPIVN